MATALGDKFNIFIITRCHDFNDDKIYSDVELEVINECEGLNVIYVEKPNVFSIFRHIQNIRPEIIHLNSYFSIFTLYVLILKKLSIINIQIILTPRGELQENALKIKSIKKTLYINFFKLLNFHKDICFHATSFNESKSIRSLVSQKAVIIPNLALNNSSHSPNWNIKGKKFKIMFLSRIRDNKNLLYVFDILQELNELEITFHIYGIVEDHAYWAICKKRMKLLPSNINVFFKGSVMPLDVQKTMASYHIFIFPTKTENFGHVIVEALQVGLVTIISNNTPWSDIEKFKAGWSIPLSDKKKYISTFKKVFSLNTVELERISARSKIYIKKKVDLSLNINKYKEMYLNVLK